jgi:hypothetical protein
VQRWEDEEAVGNGEGEGIKEEARRGRGRTEGWSRTTYGKRRVN